MRHDLTGAGGVLLLGGLLMGVLPVPLSDFGCSSAFTSQVPMEDDGRTGPA